MMKISKALSSRWAKHYYRKNYSHVKNNCFTCEDVVAGEWFGELAEDMELTGQIAAEMGVTGDVDWDHYECLVQAQDPHTGRQLTWLLEPYTYTNRDGKRITTDDYCAGWDAVFSAPTSVSLAAVVRDNARIRGAHGKAVDAALVELEKYIHAKMDKSSVRTGRMVAAKFEHDLSPADKESGYVKPYLHTHTIIFNLTQLSGGEWRTLDSRELFRSEGYATAIYRKVLAGELERLGYEIEVDGETGAPEIKGFTKEYLEANSVRAEDLEMEFDMEARSARKVFEAIEPHTQDCNRTLPLIELRRGDIIEIYEGRGIITEIDDDGISVIAEDGEEGSLALEEQFVIKRSPDQIEDWIFLSLEQGEPIHVYLMKMACGECGFVGWAVVLRVEGCRIINARRFFHYPGVRRQLREFFAAHPDMRAGFGAVKDRFSKTTGETDLSQGCAKCDALWDLLPLNEEFRSHIVALPYSVESGHIIPIFEVEISRLFDEGGSSYEVGS
jgi:conjugative relaxase-like TrwC/TraI family protein